MREHEPSTPIVAPQDVSAPGLRSIFVARDALGNVFVTGDGNNVCVTLLVADERLASLAPFPQKPNLDGFNPYRGLDPFFETDAALFFGRTKLVRRAWVLFQSLQQGDEPRILAFVGASGSGKSSLVRAGFLPELARDPIEGMDRPNALVLRPGPMPLEQLDNVLSRLGSEHSEPPLNFLHRSADGSFRTLHERLRGRDGADHSRTVIVVDQFEELFTECADSDARQAFLGNLAFAAAHEDRLISVVVTLRSDFAAAVEQPAAFVSAVRAGRLVVQGMDRDELADAIARPAQASGAPWPAALVESLVGQAEGRAGALPLLQFTLKRLWPDHAEGRLNHSRWSSSLIEDFLVEAADALFDAAGGIDGARTADQRIIRRSFLAMVQLGEGVADTRRVARLSDIVASGEDADRVRRILAPFIDKDARLISASKDAQGPTYELTHEALINSWGKLRSWLGYLPDMKASADTRASLRLRRRMEVSATEWMANGDRLDLLWSGFDLQRLGESVIESPGDLTDLQSRFFEASKRARNRAAHAKTLMQGVVWAAAVALAVLLAISIRAESASRDQTAIAASATAHADEEAGKAREATKLALQGKQRALLTQARFLSDSARQSNERYDYGTAAALSIEALVDHDAKDGVMNVPEAEVQLHTALWGLREKRVLVAQGSSINLIRFSPDGRRLVTAGSDGTNTLWNVADGSRIATLPGHLNSVMAAAFSPDDKLLVTGSADGAMRLWNGETGHLINVLPAHDQMVTSLSFSADSQRIVSASWDLAPWATDLTGAKKVVVQGHTNHVWSAALSRDGSVLLSAGDDGSVRISNANDGTLIREILPSRIRSVGSCCGVLSAALSTDGGLIFTTSRDGRARSFDSMTGDKLADVPGIDGGCTKCAALSRDGTWFVAGLADGSIAIYAARTGKLTRNLIGRCGAITTRTSEDDGMVLAACADGTARIWSSASGSALAVFGSHEGPLTDAEFAPGNSGTVATAGIDGTARLWKLAPVSGAITIPLRHAGISWAGFSPDGARLAVAGAEGSIDLVSRSGSSVGTLTGHRMSVRLGVFSKGGKRLATVDAENAMWLWDPAAGGPVKQLVGHNDRINSVAFSPDGAVLASSSSEGRVILWDAATGAKIREIGDRSRAMTLVLFSPDGSRILTVSNSPTAQLWDGLGNPVAALDGHTDTVITAAFSLDGSKIVTGSKDQTARIFDSKIGLKGAVLEGGAGNVYDVRFGADANRVITTSTDGVVRLWNTDTAAPLVTSLRGLMAPPAADETADGRKLAIAWKNEEVRVFDTRTGSIDAQLQVKPEFVNYLRFSPDGKVLLGRNNFGLQLWQLPSGDRVAEVAHRFNPRPMVDFAVDSRSVVYLLDDGLSVLPIWETSRTLLEKAQTLAPRRLSLKQRRSFFLE